MRIFLSNVVAAIEPKSKWAWLQKDTNRSCDPLYIWF